MTELNPSDSAQADLATEKAEVRGGSQPSQRAASKDGSAERPVSTRAGPAKPVFDADPVKLAAQINGNRGVDVAKPAPTPTHATAVGMLLTSWAELKMKFADFDHELDMDDPVQAELQDVIDFVRPRA